MVLRAMFSGVSGLRAEGEALGVVGDNIANVNTVGFKAQRAVFQDVLGHSILAGTSSALPGSGVRMGDVQQLFTQGSITNTGVSTDVALNGDGFLVVAGTVDGITGNFYTRAGQLTLDKNGFIVNQQGLNVQGYLANADGTLQASVNDLQVPTASLQPFATTGIQVTANLDPRDPVLTFDVTQAAQTSNFSTSISVFDSLGTARTLDVYFNNAGGNLYNYSVVAHGEDLAGGTAGVDQVVGTGTLQFNSDGALDTATTPPLSLSFAGGATANQAIELDFGPDITNDGSTGLLGTTQFASDSAVSSQSQDGYTSGEFSGLAIDGTGLVQGLYTNGQKVTIGQLAVAKFRSNDGLGRAGQNLWIETRESGTAALGGASTGGRASVSAGALESSNVDLGEEFVGLIQHQRSFSANSKTITTADEMLQELINIKR
ncbi:MAG TPA: flagellar hook protein FlgE [Polyangiaceae bacterium]|nr:flagellar hook protein FlgE [Polyangiaceae bacterium]